MIDISFSYRLQNTVIAYGAYIYKMFWPVDLAVFYPCQPLKWPVWLLLASFALLAGISLLMLATWKSHPYMLTGWLWYLGTLVPVIGLVQVGSQAYADRYSYVPLTGLFFMLVWGIPELFQKAKLSPDLPPVLGVLAVGLCMCDSPVFSFPTGKTASRFSSAQCRSPKKTTSRK